METQDNLEKQYQDAARKTENKSFASMDKIWGRIEERLDEKKQQRSLPFRKISMAAAILLLVGSGGFYLYQNRNTTTIISPAIVKKDHNQAHPNPDNRPDINENALTQTQVATSDTDTRKQVRVQKRKDINRRSIAAIAAKDKKTIKGVLKDENGEPLIGASIRIKGTNTSTLSDMDGKYELQTAKSDQQVEISATGYEQIEIAIKGGDTLLTAYLEPAHQVLSDVVITTPYGPPSTRERYVGAADVITAKVPEKTPVSDISKAIEGAAPGVAVTNGGGQPGSGSSIQIRGKGSLNTQNAPLIVVDGVPFLGDLTAISAKDVENMTVLKDEASTALYGARGANGVILITTKKASLKVRAQKEGGLKRAFQKIKKLFTKQPVTDSTPVIKGDTPLMKKDKTE